MVIVSVGCMDSAYGEANIIGLGTLGGSWSVASAVSTDGRLVVGHSYLAGNVASHAFRWSEVAGSMQDLGTLGGSWSWATAVSADGGVVVGDSYLIGAGDDDATRAFRWTEATGMQSVFPLTAM